MPANILIERDTRIRFTAPTKFGKDRPLVDAVYKPASWKYNEAEVLAIVATRVAAHEAAVEAPPREVEAYTDDELAALKQRLDEQLKATNAHLASVAAMVQARKPGVANVTDATAATVRR